MDNNENLCNQISVGKIIISFPIIYNTVTFIYCIITGRYNGDYIGYPIYNKSILVLAYILSFIPYLILWRFYIFFSKKKQINKPIIPNNKILKPFIICVILWQIFVSLVFGVGQMGDDPYSAPSFIKPIIQIFNRFPTSFIGAVYIALYCRNNINQFLKIAFLIIIAGLAKKSISAPIYVIYLFIIFYPKTISTWIKKYKLSFILLIIFIPSFVQLGYSFRDSLRGKQSEYTNSQSLIFGKLFGRLSSLSDLSFIMENIPYFIINSYEIEPLYFQKQVLSGSIGMYFAPKVTPEKQLFNTLGDGSSNTSYMCSIPGNMIISIIKSPYVLVINILTLLFIYYATFRLIALIQIPKKNLLALFLLISPTNSGVANELAFIPMCILILILFLKLFNGIGKRSLIKPKI